MPLDRIDRNALLIVLAVFFFIDAAIVIFLLIALKTSASQILIFVPALLLIPPLAVWLLIRLLWVPFARRFPPQPIAPDALSKTWQSFALGKLCRFNNCLIISVDLHHLHVQCMPPISWLGAPRISIPWNLLSNPRPTRFGNWVIADLHHTTISGPQWCMSLVNPGSSKVSP